MVDQDLLQAIGQMFDAKLVSIATKDDVLQELHRSEKLLLDEMERLHNDTIDKFSKQTTVWTKWRMPFMQHNIAMKRLNCF